MRRRVLALASALGLAAGGIACTPAPTFPLPMTASELARYGTGHALVAYLGQPDASPAVCDPEAKGPHLGPLDEGGVSALVRALDAGLLPPDVFRRCAEHLLRTPAGPGLLDRLGGVYRDAVKNPEIEKDPNLERRLEALL